MGRLVQMIVAGTLLASIAQPAVSLNGPASGLVAVYAPIAQAVVLHDGGDSVAGLGDQLWLQAPTATDRRFPSTRWMAKVKGDEVAASSPQQMAAILRTAITATDRGGLVAIDEILAGVWSEARLRNLGAALDQLGPQAERVIVYIGPGVVGAIGRIDLRQPLPPRWEALLTTLRRAGGTVLETYHGDLRPFSRAELAADTTRWLARWGPGEVERLHLMLGPSIDSSQAEIWERARATEAGRRLLANGPFAYGLRSREATIGWLAGYRDFLANPLTPPAGGDEPVPVGGGLAITLVDAATASVTLSRAGRAVVQVIPAGATSGRVIAKLDGPVAAARVAIPRDTRPGRYTLRVVAMGDGLRDDASVALVVAPQGVIAGRPSLLRAVRGRGRSIIVGFPGTGRGNVQVIRVGARNGPVVRAFTGPVSRLSVPLPAGLAPGNYRIRVVTIGPNGREQVTIPLAVTRRWASLPK
jgi:hypothetical protein